MNFKQGTVVSHAGAIEWGVGMVTEVDAGRVTIQFSDGITRKIASTHYTNLKPADPASFVPLPGAPVVEARPAPKRRIKAKQPAA